MSLVVRSVVPGTDTVRARRQPSRISHHWYTRGSMTKMRSPGASPAPSLDHLVGPEPERLGNGKPEGLGRLEIDDKLELGGLLDGEIGRLGTLEDAAYLHPGPLKHVRVAGPVGYQPADIHELLGSKHRWNACLRGKLDDGNSVAEGQRIGKDQECHAPLLQRRQATRQAFRALDLDRFDLDAQHASRLSQFVQRDFRGGNGGIPDHRDTRASRR